MAMHTKTRRQVELVACVLIAGLVAALPAQGTRVALGRLSTGPTAAFVRAVDGTWGLDVSGGSGPHISGAHPIRFEIFVSDADVRQVSAGYQTAESVSGGVVARADVDGGPGVTFRVEDRWSMSGAVMSVRRMVEVRGTATGGFDSGVMLATAPDVTWSDADYFAPGLLYGDVSHNGDRAPGGALNFAARRLTFREDNLAAPLLAMAFKKGTSIAVLDPSPKGNTTTAETNARGASTITDERLLFGALGAHQSADGGVEFGFWLPGTSADPGGGGGGGGAGRGAGGAGAPAPAVAAAAPAPTPPPASAAPTASYRRRYHPIKQGLVQNYEVAFRFGQERTFPDVTRDTFRWAWATLKPAVFYQDIPLVQKTLIDFLADRVMTVDGRTGLPYLLDARTGKFMDRADASRAAMGFCAKNIEAADQFLREADRDTSPRGQRLRKLGLDIIATFIRTIPMSPPAGDGFDLLTGQLATAVWSVGQQFLRTLAEDHLVMLHAYQREKALGRDHPEWLQWTKQYVDWMETQQRPDGSFPRAWKPGTSEVINPSGSASYSPPPLLVAMSQITGDKKYLDSAVRAGEYLWANWGVRGIYDGGASDASSMELVTDKEAGMLSMEAFLSLHDATKDAKWLARAQSAADYTESWIWIWDVPMPEDANNDLIEWKKGVPTVGFQGITARGAGGVDEYLDWAAPMYAELYNKTKDTHYLDVARILLHNTKAMLALPGRTYGMLGPGWQQEHWQMSTTRGYGQAGKWLPWLATNHLNSIMSLEDYDRNLYKTLIAKPAVAR
jgi:hypothetical protein